MHSENAQTAKTHYASVIVNPAYPCLGASPDGKIVDKSVEEPYGLLEIKCPFKHGNKHPLTAADETGFCLVK